MSFYQHPGTIEIFSQAPADAPQHAGFEWMKGEVAPAGGRVRTIVWSDGGWKVEVECRKVRKDGTPSEAAVYIEFSPHSSMFKGEFPQYVIDAAEHAKHVRDYAFPPETTTED